MSTGTPPGHDSKQRALLIIGPHRSGTSLLARGLLCSGWSIGSTLIQANQDNPKGFFENASIVALNDAMLSELGLAWDCMGAFDSSLCDALNTQTWRDRAIEVLDKEYDKADGIVIKDPRLSLLAPFWDNVLRHKGFHPSYILAIRHPLESAQSQAARHEAKPDQHFTGSRTSEGIHLWVTYLHSALTMLARVGGFVVDYPRLLNQPDTVLRSLAEALDLQMPNSQISEFAEKFVSRSLRHHEVDPLHEDSPLRAYQDTYHSIQESTEDLTLGPQAAQQLCKLIEKLLKSDKLLVGDLNRMYSKARNAAVRNSMTVEALRNELEKAHNIIRYNEYLIRSLSNGKSNETDNST